jgi:bisphosphoglycerate-dependent phosphoglycerate mutase
MQGTVSVQKEQLKILVFCHQSAFQNLVQHLDKWFAQQMVNHHNIPTAPSFAYTNNSNPERDI